jgi:hypothetical protein
MHHKIIEGKVVFEPLSILITLHSPEELKDFVNMLEEYVTLTEELHSGLDRLHADLKPMTELLKKEAHNEQDNK